MAPHLLPVEVANILRRVELTWELSPDVATHAHADLLDAPLATLDHRLARASGLRCRFLTP